MTALGEGGTIAITSSESGHIRQVVDWFSETGLYVLESRMFARYEVTNS
jgi:hypothetical protein